MTLSLLAILLGVAFSLPQVYALANREGYRRWLRGFHRSESIGYLLMGTGTAWFLYNLHNEAIADFASYKKLMLVGFGAIGLGTCLYVKDYLAVRGLAVVMLLTAWYTLNFTRLAETPWRLVLVVWAYIWVIGGMWLTISPHRLRDYFHWLAAKDERLRSASLARLAFGVFVIVLGLTAYRG
jgi:hypothetical protein